MAPLRRPLTPAETDGRIILVCAKVEQLSREIKAAQKRHKCGVTITMRREAVARVRVLAQGDARLIERRET